MKGLMSCFSLGKEINLYQLTSNRWFILFADTHKSGRIPRPRCKTRPPQLNFANQLTFTSGKDPRNR